MQARIERDAQRQQRKDTPRSATPEGAPASRTPWADNVKLGTIYLEREPSGFYRVSLVMPDETGKGRQVSSSSKLVDGEVYPTLKLLAKRLAPTMGTT